MQEVNCKSLDKTLIKDIVKNMEIDKPIPARIIIKPKDPLETGENFLRLSSTLYSESLIFDEPRELRRVKGRFELTVIFRDINSFKNWKKSPSVIKFWSHRFKNYLKMSPLTLEESDVIIDIDHVQNCTCEQTEYYIFEGRSLQFNDELTCNHCLQQVSYNKISHTIEIESWQKHHQRVYMNWLESSFFEKQV